MKINFNLVNNQIPKKVIGEKNKTHNYQERTNFATYNPLAYRDYNISFGKRLFRSPENFYEQSFNKENMPETLKRYIYDRREFDFRQTIPPSQAMKEVFEDIKLAETLEEVKELYSNESLFAELHSAPSRKARTGVLGEVALIRNEGDSKTDLFKNGDNDLGMYLIKKIYLEGKTLNEINKDFKKDISKVYDGISNLQYTDMKAFGIKFPKQDFWKSFIATREDFPYVFIPKKEVTLKNNVEIKKSEPINIIRQPVVRRKLTDEQKRMMSDYMKDLWKNLPEEERERRRNKIKIGQENSFYFQYLSPIMVMAADSVGLSDKLSDYMQEVYGDDEYILNFDDPSEKQKKIMKGFWEKNPELSRKYGQAISDAIVDFELSYGVDGKNNDFEILLYIANGIKENNFKKIEDRKKRRQEIEETFAKVDTELDDEMEELNKRFGTVSDIINRTFTDGKSLLEKDFETLMYSELKMTPSAYAKKCGDFMLSHTLMTDDVKLSILSRGKDLIPYRVMSKEETDKIAITILAEFEAKNSKITNAAEQAMIDIIVGANIKIPLIVNCDIGAISDKSENLGLFNKLSLDKNLPKDKAIEQYKEDVNNKFAIYNKKLSSKEIQQIKRAIYDYLLQLNPKDIKGKLKLTNDTLKLISKNANTNKELKEMLFSTFDKTNFIDNYGGCTRALLDGNLSKEAKNICAEKFLLNFFENNPKSTTRLMALNKRNMESVLLPENHKLYSILTKLYTETSDGRNVDDIIQDLKNNKI